MQDIIIQTELGNRNSMAKVSCGICGTDTFAVITKGQSQIFKCEECKKR